MTPCVQGLYACVESQVKIDELDIRLMTLGSIVIRMDELPVVLRHRNMLIVYVVTWMTLFPFRYRDDSGEAIWWWDLPQFVIQQFVALLITIGAMFLVAGLQRGRSRPVVHATPLIAAGLVVALVGGELLAVRVGWADGLDLTELLAVILFATMVCEVVASIAVNFLLPGILAELRAPDGPRAASDAVAQGIAPETLRTVTVGPRTVLVRDILHVRAEGNYVDVTLRSGRLFTLATLRSVVEQMPPEDGVMIHRSLWIATAAFAGYRRAGADLHVKTVDGREFKVARSRHGELLPWLKARAAELGMTARRGA